MGGIARTFYDGPSGRWTWTAAGAALAGPGLLLFLIYRRLLGIPSFHLNWLHELICAVANAIVALPIFFLLDRARNDLGGSRDPRRMASIAATGFGLTALSIADKRGYLPHAQIVERVRTTLDWHLNKFPFYGTTLLISVGVALETMRQIDSQLMMRNYEGFLK